MDDLGIVDIDAVVVGQYLFYPVFEGVIFSYPPTSWPDLRLAALAVLTPSIWLSIIVDSRLSCISWNPFTCSGNWPNFSGRVNFSPTKRRKKMENWYDSLALNPSKAHIMSLQWSAHSWLDPERGLKQVAPMGDSNPDFSQQPGLTGLSRRFNPPAETDALNPSIEHHFSFSRF